MCGICGILGQPNKNITKRMAQAMERRGPDGEGFYFDIHVSLGVKRLQITGPSENDQPLWNEDKTICIVFNGEIYNFRELRAGLEARGHRFCSSSDTEVILHLYEDYGEQCVQHLRGMFAFAIWDGQGLFLARDRMGIKPLFYACIDQNRQFIFASEIKALIEHPCINADRHAPSWDELNVFGYVLSETDTLINDVKQVRPGATTKVTCNNGIISTEERAYTCTNLNSDTTNVSSDLLMKQSMDRLEAGLRESCSRIMNQDIRPKGVYLSGGIDSSLLAVLCREESAIPIHTFTLGDSENNEDILHAREVADAIGAVHHEIIVDKEECEREYPNFLQACEVAPSKGTFDMHGDFCFFLLSKYVSQHVKVAVCGEGADELIGGYWMHRWPLGYVDSLRERVAGLDRSSRLQFEQKLTKWFPADEDEETYRRGVFDLLLGTGLSNYHLWAVDRSSMWYGLEVRVPYLYESVVEAASSIPINLRATRDNTKIVTRMLCKKLFEPYSLRRIINRSKKAMPNAIEHLLWDIPKSCVTIY